jgi:hypothetical protein
MRSRDLCPAVAGLRGIEEKMRASSMKSPTKRRRFMMNLLVAPEAQA